MTLDGIALGDCWKHPALKSDDATSELMPLHKLSQWLSYSLIEPLQTAGIEVTDIDGLTGLAEYRNGGLFVDIGVLAFRDPADADLEHDVSSTLVVEWRALTVALLDRLAEGVRQKLQLDSTSLPLAKILEGGSWAAGRVLARQRRADSSPPVKVISDGTHKLTLIRDKTRSTKGFRELLNEIGMLLCYEVTRDLPLTDVEIETPITKMIGKEIAGKKLVFAPILRAGLSFVEGMIDLVPSARIAHIGLYRDPETFVAVEYFFKAPGNLDERLVIVIDPMLATANTANAATVSPGADTRDGRVHFTPANLATHLHRSIEPVVTGRALATIFRSEKHFVHHAPLPATPQMGDEGAANHTRLCAEHDGHGLELFVYGEAGEKDPKPAVHPARQNRAAGEAIARLHHLDPDY
eukprot:gene41086-55551_t